MPVLIFLLLGITVGALVGWIRARNSAKAAAAISANLREEGRRAAERADQAEAENAELSRFRTIVDAQGEAGRLIREGRSAADALRQKAEDLIQQARAEEDSARKRAQAIVANSMTEAARLVAEGRTAADEATRAARADAKTAREQANAVLANASSEAGRIVDAANRRAEEIAGEALAAVRGVAAVTRASRRWRIHPSAAISTTFAQRNIVGGPSSPHRFRSLLLFHRLKCELAAGGIVNPRHRKLRMISRSTSGALQ